MKRSEINRYISDALVFWEGLGFRMPPFARFGVADWQQRAADCKEIFDLQLGWDVTSFGSSDFLQCGLLLFTLRNGMAGSKEYPKPYAEKIMLVRENQVTPRHFHWHKREDIINRGGGNLVIEISKADPANNCLCGGAFSICVDGIRRRMESGDKLVLTPGESVTMESIHAHLFYGEPGSGNVMVGEVSMVNDDTSDNCFIDGAIRFDPVIEDEEPDYLLACEYRNFIRQ
jgi:D-lyxose ketol-isomerase